MGSSPYVSGEASIGNDLKAESVIKAIHSAGGLAILAHPARYRIEFKEIIKEANNLGIDGGEAWYDYDYGENWEPTQIICDQIDKQLKSYNLLSTCGTDTHGLNLFSR